MVSVCFVIDAIVTGAMLPRHLMSIRGSSIDDHLLPILVTGTRPHGRLALLEQRYHTQCLVTPTKPLGARLNQAAFTSQAEWLIIALQKQPLPASLWCSLYPQLNAYTLDTIMIGLAKPTFSERILGRLLASALLLPPYIAVRRTWLERLGGFDPELDDFYAIKDFLHRLHACSTRLKSYNGQLLREVDDIASSAEMSSSRRACTPRL